MTYAAVIFDLFGTLIDENAHGYEAMMTRMSKLLDVPPARLYKVTSADAEARNLGVYDNVGQQFDVMCKRLGVVPGAEHLTDAIREYTDFQRLRLVPRDGVLDTLRTLGEWGLKRGLISNASPVIVELWPVTAFPSYFEHAVLFCGGERHQA